MAAPIVRRPIRRFRSSRSGISNLIPAPGRSDPVSHEVRPRRVLVCRTTRDSLGSPRRLTRGCFHPRDYRLISPDRSLVICYDPELILSRLRLFRAPSLRLLAHRLSAKALPAWVLGPLRDITRAQPPNRDDSHAVTSFRPQAFPAFRRLPPRSGLQAYFIPQPRPGSLPFRGFSSRAATLPFRKELPPGRLLPPRADRLAPAATRFGPRLRGLHPRETAFDTAQLFTTLHAAPLLGFVSSRLALPSVDHTLLAISALDVSLAAPSLTRSRFELVPSVSPARSLALRLRFARLLELSSLPPNLRARDPNSPPVALR
jgi:hypothetical protein